MCYFLIQYVSKHHILKWFWAVGISLIDFNRRFLKVHYFSLLSLTIVSPPTSIKLMMSVVCVLLSLMVPNICTQKNHSYFKALNVKFGWTIHFRILKTTSENIKNGIYCNLYLVIPIILDTQSVLKVDIMYTIISSNI